MHKSLVAMAVDILPERQTTAVLTRQFCSDGVARGCAHTLARIRSCGRVAEPIRFEDVQRGAVVIRRGRVGGRPVIARMVNKGTLSDGQYRAACRLRSAWEVPAPAAMDYARACQGTSGVVPDCEPAMSRAHALARLTGGLTSVQRELCQMLIVEDRCLKEIAERVGMDARTVKRQVLSGLDNVALLIENP